ncbi:MAG: transposase, partial [Betaproteobacteria bacterium]|nr:transposase [Betaproteobacteria bacterium]
KKQTRRERFLSEMEAVIPWPELLSLIEPHYPKPGRRDRQPMPLETMQGYVNNALKRAARRAGVFWGVSLKARPKQALSKAQRRFNRKMSSVRARVEHVFRVMKCQFGYRKVRYKGIAKNAAQVFSLIGLANLYLARRKLLSP